ncbi:MAG: NAD(P)/FAD-dependent oxidoreductase [Alphaproteobacteria bacterium]|nr:NAD(P)/FAD-dependent oxidoreductase [Alphaproteobacteria bacterium]
MRYDALIIGSGPAGSSAARLLAQAGWRVALVEKAEFPRRKVCGEFISATTMPVLKDCGVAVPFIAAAGPLVTRVGIYAGKAMLAAPREQSWGRALGREHLDVMLRDAARTAGAELFAPMEVTAVTRDGDGFLGTLDDGRSIAARTVIAACGSWNTKGVFAVPLDAPSPSDLFAFKAHFSGGALPDGLMPLLAFPGGYGGLVHTDEGRISLSCCIRRDAMTAARARHGGKAAEAVLAHIMETTRGVQAALGDAGLQGHFLSTGPIHPGIRARFSDGIYFTGNIAGEAHPVIAEGISMAIQSSGLLAKLLIAHRGETYAKEWKKRFAPRIRAASVFAHLAMRAPTRFASLTAIRAMPGLLGLGARLSGKAPISA